MKTRNCDRKGDDFLLLKWGTLKGWCVKDSPKAAKLIKQYIKLGVKFSVIMQKDTLEQKKLICKIIDAINGPVINDWTGRTYRKASVAKDYVMKYQTP